MLPWLLLEFVLAISICVGNFHRVRYSCRADCNFKPFFHISSKCFLSRWVFTYVYFVLLFQSFSVDNLYLLIKYCRRSLFEVWLVSQCVPNISSSLVVFFCSRFMHWTRKTYITRILNRPISVSKYELNSVSIYIRLRLCLCNSYVPSPMLESKMRMRIEMKMFWVACIYLYYRTYYIG